MDTHYVDQYIRQKKRSESAQPDRGNNTSASSASVSTMPPPPQQQQQQQQHQQQQQGAPVYPSQQQQDYGTTNYGRAPSAASPTYLGGGGGGVGGGGRGASSTMSGGGGIVNQAAHHVLLTAAQRAQHEVDAIHHTAAEMALREEHGERLERQYHLLSERVDTAALQVAAAEDKVINVTKMLKMLQQLSEDREKGLRDEAGDLRAKVKRLERALDQEREAREKASEGMTAYIRDTVERAMEKQQVALRGEFQRQLDQFDGTLRGVSRSGEELRTDVDEVRRVADKFNSVLREVEQFCTRFADETRSSTRTLVESRLEEFRIRNDGNAQRVDDLRSKVELMHDQLSENIETQHDLRRSVEDTKRAHGPLKEWVDDRLALLKTDVREHVAKESDLIQKQMHLSIANTDRCVEANENGVSEVREELERLAATMHTHVKTVEGSNAKAAESFQDLRDISTQSRDLLLGQLEATKDWAGRNILRLKKHLDLAVSDMAATRQAQLEIQVSFQRLTQAHQDEKAAMMAQLAHKTKEASLLTNAVDKEVAEVALMMNDFEESRRHAQMKRQAKDELRALSHMP